MQIFIKIIFIIFYHYFVFFAKIDIISIFNFLKLKHMQNKIKELEKLINNSQNIALYSHIRMDPDTFWSAWALYFILKKIWKTIILLNDEQAPVEFEFMWSNEIITTSWNLEEFKPDLIISLDAASIEQLWDSYKNNIKTINTTPFIVIDHHITNKWFWTLNIIDTKSSSTCELLFELLEQLNLIKYIDSKISTLLITWILTDTNVFYNTNVTSKTHQIAWKLFDLWADSRTSIFEFFKKKSVKKTQLLAKALWNMKILENKLNNWKNVIYTIIKQEDFDSIWATNRDTNWIIEHLINIENIEIAFIVYPLENWINKASLRSHSYNVSELAQKLWWGWHKQAAWCSSSDSLEIFLEKIIWLI